MNFTSVSFIIDVMGMLLLAAVIFYTIRLNQHFQMLQKNRAELARQLSGFAHSTDRAEAAIQQVRQSTRDSAQQMEELLQKGETLKADLGYLIERAGTLADQLEGNVRRDRDQESGARSSRRVRSSRIAEDTPEPAPSLRASRKTEPEAEPPMGTPRARASALEQTATGETSTPSRRRRRGGRAAPTDEGDQASNSELLKVLQGMR